MCQAELQESGKKLSYCIVNTGARVLPEGLHWERRGFLLWKSNHLLIDINSTHEMLAMMLREAVEREGNLILLGGRVGGGWEGGRQPVGSLVEGTSIQAQSLCLIAPWLVCLL